ncbi:MAG: tRNA (adenosine(37)-N6)-threonylcarbamoyltransferase complex dimerization subunit type 1 TsaB [Syntrophomonadaceae bacterium]|nr:tRNA (adenosine(37)-N6)-threonylcarbamoyltransferase complex dimerization subunit type 1 TsaB [Syntrophomonadaceae bacterium]
MLILAIDGATPSAGVALLDENKIYYEEISNFKKTHSQNLMPMIDRALTTGDYTVRDLTAIAVTIGPGSFTGLRIALGTVKGLSLATNIPVVAVSTLDTLAFNLNFNHNLVAVLLDARRNEVYTAFYDASGIYPVPISDELAISPEDFVSLAHQLMVKNNYTRIILLGDGFYPYADFFRKSFNDKLLNIPTHLILPRPTALGNLAIERVKAHSYSDIFSLSPTYLRLSEAEYKLKQGEI